MHFVVQIKQVTRRFSRLICILKLSLILTENFRKNEKEQLLQHNKHDDAQNLFFCKYAFKK